MDTSCASLKTEFSELVDIRNDILNLLESLKMKITKLKEIYSDFIKNNPNNLFIFGLDALRFQGKLLDVEYDDMLRMFYAINNRMYCEYYKMHTIIHDYMVEIIKNNKLFDTVNLQNTFPVYKDLEPYKQYDFEILKQIHEKIITLISTFNSYILSKEQELKIHRAKNSTGLNIDNFVSTFNYDIIMMREKETLFLSYMEYFHTLHSKYMNRFSTKIKLMYSQINNDIKFDNTNDLNQTSKKQDLLKSIAKENNANEALIAELKHSIHKNRSIDSLDTVFFSNQNSQQSRSQSNASSVNTPNSDHCDTHSIYGTTDDHFENVNLMQLKSNGMTKGPSIFMK
jgi:hypothetical protein